MDLVNYLICFFVLLRYWSADVLPNYYSMHLLTHLHLSVLFIRVTYSSTVHGQNTLMSPALTAVVVKTLLFFDRLC